MKKRNGHSNKAFISSTYCSCSSSNNNNNNSSSNYISFPYTARGITCLNYSLKFRLLCGTCMMAMMSPDMKSLMRSLVQWYRGNQESTGRTSYGRWATVFLRAKCQSQNTFMGVEAIVACFQINLFY